MAGQVHFHIHLTSQSDELASAGFNSCFVAENVGFFTLGVPNMAGVVIYNLDFECL